MIRARRKRQRGQHELNRRESFLEEERTRCFRGTIKIDIQHLHFDDPGFRDIDEPNVHRLTDIFEQQGCKRLEPDHQIPATVDDNLLETWLEDGQHSRDDILSRDASRWPLLRLCPNTTLQCLHGRHRFAAAELYLVGQDRCDVADTDSGLSEELAEALIEQTSNENSLSAGEIYCRVLCDHRQSKSGKNSPFWAWLQSDDKKYELSRLMNRERFQCALYDLTDMPSLWRDIRAGMAGRLLRLKCDEEVIHYLHHIYRAWSTVMNEDLAHMVKIDLQTVRALEARSPFHSITDAAYLEPMIRNSELFASFSAPKRQGIWARMQVFPGMIPSFTTFFEGFKYLEAVADCLKRLVRPPYRQTVRQGFRAAFDNSAAVVDDDGRQTDFASAYRQLFIFAMKNLEELRPGSKQSKNCPELTLTSN